MHAKHENRTKQIPAFSRIVGFFNYVRMPVTYTVGPALNTILWLGEGVCTTGVALVYLPYLLLTSDKD